VHHRGLTGLGDDRVVAVTVPWIDQGSGAVVNSQPRADPARRRGGEVIASVVHAWHLVLDQRLGK
jgi:hypothetical protein